MIATQFVQWEIQPLENLNGSRVYQLREKRNNAYFRTAVPLMGYRFDFSDVLRKFLVNQYGQWNEYYAPDKTSLRNTLYGTINQIVEIQSK